MTRLVPVAPLEIDTWLSNVRKQGRVVYRVRLIIQHQGRRVRVAPDWPASAEREENGTVGEASNLRRQSEVIAHRGDRTGRVLRPHEA